MMGRRRHLVINRRRRVDASSPRSYWDLNGTDEYLSDSTNSTLGVANQWSMLVSARLDSVAATDRRLVQFRQSSGNANVVILYWNNLPLGLTLLLFNSSGSSFKDLTWDNSVFTNDGDAAHIIVTFDGEDTGDPVVLYKNGSPVSPSSGTDGTGTMTDTDRRTAISTDPNSLGSDPWDGAVQDVAIFASVLSSVSAATLYAQRNDADPMSGFSPTVHLTPQDPDDMGKNYGSGAAIDVMANASGITAAEDRIQGNLIP